MEREVKNKAASIRAKLMNVAKSEKIDFDALLLRYFQERFLCRLAISEFSDRFVLKGGLLLICLKMPRSRPTKDIYFLAEQVKNDPAELEYIFRTIVDLLCDDGVKFVPLSITSERIKEDTDYEGVRLKINATLSQARKRLQMDIGFGDVIIPKAKLTEFPTLLEEKPPKVKVYSIESIISEKFEAMVKLAMANSRVNYLAINCKACNYPGSQFSPIYRRALAPIYRGCYNWLVDKQPSHQGYTEMRYSGPH